MPSSGSHDVDRLRAAIDAHERFVAEHGHGSVSEFLAAHEDLRDLLEPLLAQARPPPQQDTAGTRVLGDFRLLGEIGRGGMGIVYDAEQISLGRRVAVKVLPGRLVPDADRRARFERESRLAASLDHPGIAKVISADADDEVVWFAMERIDGAPLDGVLRRLADTEIGAVTGGLFEAVVDDLAPRRGGEDARAGFQPSAPHDRGQQGAGAESTVWRAGYVDTVVRIGAQVAAALHHAHEHGVIHRDVKPANVMLRRDGSAVLTDFGLARDLNVPSLTVTGSYFGTPSYSAPEQLAGERAAVDHRADIFALGVTLYELVTLRRPFEASTTDEVRARILTVEPARPRRLNSMVPPDLNSVLLKALEKDPNARYQTAAAMAKDLLAVAGGRAVHARTVRAHTRVRRWSRRNPWAATALAAMLGVVLLLITMGGQLARAHAVQSKQRVDAGLALARSQDFPGALDGLIPLEREFPGARTQAALHELFRRHPCLASHALVSEPDERVVRARFSSDGRWVATLHERANDRFVRLCRVPMPDDSASQPLSTWRSEPSPGKRTTGNSMVHADSGRTVAWVKDDDTVCVGGPDRQTSSIEFTESVRALVRASTPGRFGVGFESRVELRDSDRRVECEWALTCDLVRSQPVILDDVLVWFRRLDSDAGCVMVSAAPGAEPVEVGIEGWPTLTQFDSGDSARMFVTTDGWMTTWRCRNGRLEREGRRENRLPSGMSYARISRMDPVIDDDAAWRGQLAELPLWRSNLVSRPMLAFGRDGAREPYLVAVEDRALRLWGMPEPRTLHAASQLDIARVEPGARRVWSAGFEPLTAWSLDAESQGSRQIVETPGELRDAVKSGMKPDFCGIAFDPGRAILACARGDGSSSTHSSPGWVCVVPDADELVATSYRCRFDPTWIELSPDREQLAVAEVNGGVELWKYDSDRRELTDSSLLPALGVDATRLSCVRYLGERFLLATVGVRSSRGAILRWDLDAAPDTPPVPVEPQGIRDALRCLAISDDEQLVATGGDDRVVRVLRVVWQDGKPTLEPAWQANHTARVFAVAFARRDGALILASADDHGEVRLWDAETRGERGIVRDAAEGDEMIMSLEFSSDGDLLVAAQSRGRVLLWDMDRPGRCLEGNRDCAEQLLRLRAEAR